MALQRMFAWCIGMELPSHPLLPESERFWFIVYALSSMIYRWFIMFGIVVVLYTVLKPYKLQSIGLSWAIFAVGMMVVGVVKSGWKTTKEPKLGPHNRRRLVVSLLATAAVVAIVGVIPIPVSRTHECYVEPIGVRYASTQVEGRLSQIVRRPGESVQEDDVIAQLENDQITAAPVSYTHLTLPTKA